jgi:hypothetical protein
MVEVFAPQKSADTTNQGFGFFPRVSVKLLPAFSLEVIQFNFLMVQKPRGKELSKVPSLLRKSLSCSVFEVLASKKVTLRSLLETKVQNNCVKNSGRYPSSNLACFGPAKDKIGVNWD